MSLRRDKRSKRQPCWILDYIDENLLRHRKRVHCTLTMAQRMYLELLDEIEKRKMGFSNGHQLTPLENLVVQYLVASETDGKSLLTINRIKNATDACTRIIGKTRLITEISPHTIETYKSKRLTEFTPRKTRLTPAGLNSELKHLRAMFNWAVKMGMLQRSPFLGVKLVKSNPKPVRFLTTGELGELYRAIVDAEDTDAYGLITFYLQTGARRSELIPPKFTWVNIDLPRRFIVLIGKRNKRRTVPLNNQLAGILNSKNGSPCPFDFSPDQVSRMVRKYYRKAGIEDANVHTLRKTCGALLIQAGVDIYRVSKWLGHSSVVVTEQHYVDLIRGDYEDLSMLMGQISTRYAPGNLVSEKVVPYLCHFPDQNRLIQTN